MYVLIRTNYTNAEKCATDITHTFIRDSSVSGFKWFKCKNSKYRNTAATTTSPACDVFVIRLLLCATPKMSEQVNSGPLWFIGIVVKHKMI